VPSAHGRGALGTFLPRALPVLRFELKRVQSGPVLAAAWLTGLVALAFAGPILWAVREWRDNPYYGHGPYVPLVSLVLVALALPGLQKSNGKGTAVGPVLLTAGLALRLLGAFAGSDFLGLLALLIVLTGFAVWWLGGPGLRALGFPVAYLLLAIPLPFMDDLGFYFQRLSTMTTSLALRGIGVPATYQGAEVSLPSASFVVGVPCSGLYSTVSLMALGLVFVRVLDLGSWWRRLALIATIPVVALASNLFRLSSLLGIAYWQDADTAMRYYHTLGDVVFWSLAMGLLFAIGKGLEWTASRGAS
jgi:exosortase